MTPVAGGPAVVRVRLLGEEFALKTDQDPADVERLAGELDARLKRLAADLNLHSQPTRLALIAGLQLVEELAELKSRHAAYESGTTAAVEGLVRRIEHTLSLEDF